MSTQELNRAGILQQVVDKKLSQAQAATSLGLSDRQVRRLMVKYRASGAAGLIHRSRGSPGNHQLSQSLKDQAIGLVRAKYLDFGPTFAAEKLEERDGLNIGVGTLRSLMINAGIWQAKRRKVTHRARRERRACYGDMEQFDGCRHDWFEGRLEDGKWATLLASRDDANNTVCAQFVAYEGTKPVMAYWRDYFLAYGKPQSIYLDRHSTYKINAKSALDDDAMLSQFERAMEQLQVRVIHAGSPQAKGRIENLFGTLQDRLVKELRLANISDIGPANKFLQDVFLPAYNKRFCVEPAVAANIHSELHSAEDLDATLSVHLERRVGQDFTIRFKNQWLQLGKVQPTLVLPGKRVKIEERLDNSIHIRLNDSYLVYSRLNHKPAVANKLPIALTSNPGTATTNVKPRTPTIPSPNHPWRSFKIKPQQPQKALTAVA